MRKHLTIAAVLLLMFCVRSFGDYNATQGSGTIFRAFATGAGGSALCAAANTQCQAVGLVNSAGAEIGTASAPVRTDPTGTTPQTVSVPTWAGGTLGAMANYGTSPGAVLVPGVNANVTNANANGQTNMAGSSPVVLPNNMSAIALWGHGANAATAPSSSTEAGCIAQNAEATAVTNGQLGGVACDLVKKPIILPYANPENFENGTTAAITDTTSTSIIASAGGSLRHYVTDCMVTNSHATVGTYVQILDGSTVLDSGFAAPVGGGFSRTYPVPRRGTAATALNCQATTTGANFKCSCGGYKGI